METRSIRSAVAIAGVVLLSGASPAAPARAEDEPSGSASIEARARYLMGSRLSIALPAPTPEATFDEAFGEVERLESVLSNWMGASELSRMNAAASRDAFHCSPDLFAAIEAALHWAEETGGAFDPTVEPLVRSFGLRGPEGRIARGAAESDAAVSGRGGAGGSARHLAPVGWKHVRLGTVERTVEFDRDGVGIDLGGIGKGIALDAAARVLTRRGIHNALLDFGGQILAIGPPPGRLAWPVGIADPFLRDRAIEWIDVRSGSVSTSGDSERSVPGENGPIGHILDPVAQSPAPSWGSVTVLAPDAASADALSTALFVMGPDRGRGWADRHRVAALFLERRPDGRLRRTASTGFKVASHPSGGG